MLFWCGFAGILFLVAILQFYKTRWFVVFRNFRVISMWFIAVFLCYSVWYLYVIQCSFVVFLPPLCPPPPLIKWQQWHEDELKLWQKKDNPKYNSEILTATWPWPSQYAKWLLLKFRRGTMYTPTLHRKGTWLITASCRGRSRNIPNIGGRMRGLQTSKYYNCFKPLFSPFWTCCYIFLFCVAKFITDEMQIWKRILHIICGKIPDNQQFYCFPPFLCYAVFD